MTQNAKEFIRFLAENPDVNEKLNGLEKSDEQLYSKIIAIASEHGFELAEEDFIRGEGELDPDELRNVAGGGDCYCFIGGGGASDNDRENVCACIGSGLGNDSDKKARCYCDFAGEGVAS